MVGAGKVYRAESGFQGGHDGRYEHIARAGHAESAAECRMAQRVEAFDADGVEGLCMHAGGECQGFVAECGGNV